MKNSYSFVFGSFVFLFVSFLNAKSPNVILILADDLGYGDLSCQGSVKDVRTPHIDTLATNGISFSQAYVTAPQCGPSRAALLSGRYQNRFGFESNEWAYNPGMPKSVPLISELLKDHGYATGYIGKWGITSKRHSYPPKRGFDESFWVQDGNVYFPDTPAKYNTQSRSPRASRKCATHNTNTNRAEIQARKNLMAQCHSYAMYEPCLAALTKAGNNTATTLRRVGGSAFTIGL